MTQEPKKQARVNGAIRSAFVLLVREGARPERVATSAALAEAEAAGLDLVEVQEGATPVCKILDHGKAKYAAQKKAAASRKAASASAVVVKELQVRPKTGQHDIDRLIEKARGFLGSGDKVKFSVLFKGRERAHRDLGEKILLGVLNALRDVGHGEAPPRMSGGAMLLLLAPGQQKAPRPL